MNLRSKMNFKRGTNPWLDKDKEQLADKKISHGFCARKNIFLLEIAKKITLLFLNGLLRL